MLDHGIDQEIWDRIIRTVGSSPKVRKILLFGSHAMGNFKTGSDIDLALIGEDLSHEDILGLAVAVEELDLPWKVDLLDFARLDDPAVIDHIQRRGISVYDITQT